MAKAEVAPRRAPPSMHAVPRAVKQPTKTKYKSNVATEPAKHRRDHTVPTAFWMRASPNNKSYKASPSRCRRPSSSSSDSRMVRRLPNEKGRLTSGGLCDSSSFNERLDVPMESLKLRIQLPVLVTSSTGWSICLLDWSAWTRSNRLRLKLKQCFWSGSEKAWSPALFLRFKSAPCFRSCSTTPSNT